MSHELRTPLNSIIGFSELLEDEEFGNLNKRQRRYVNNVLKSGHQLLSLINDILDLSKAEVGHVSLMYRKFVLQDIIQPVTKLIAPLVEKKQLSFTNDLPNQPLTIIADRNKFEQIILNLLSNAVKFTPAHGSIQVKATTQIDFEKVPHREDIHIVISDTGVGIGKEHLQTIFSMFEQVDSSYSRAQDGSGLGLTLTKQFVELHGGTIWVESDGLTKGSQFHILLPRQPKHVLPLTPLPQKAKPNKPVHPLTLPKVLMYTETNSQYKRRFEQYAKDHPFTMLHVSDLSKLYQEAKRKQPSLLMLDLEEQKEQVEALVEFIQLDRQLQDIPILLTGHTPPDTHQLKNQCIYLPKDASKSEFIKTISRLTQPGQHTINVLLFHPNPNELQQLTEEIYVEHMHIFQAIESENIIECIESTPPDILILHYVGHQAQSSLRSLKQHPALQTRPIILTIDQPLTQEQKEAVTPYVEGIIERSDRGLLLTTLKYLQKKQIAQEKK